MQRKMADDMFKKNSKNAIKTLNRPYYSNKTFEMKVNCRRRCVGNSLTYRLGIN